jgi:hypothetical protein
VFHRFHSLAFNAAGAAAFDATIRELAAANQADDGIWVKSDELEVVALGGPPGSEGAAPAPGTPANFSSLSTDIVNDAAGRVAFAATIGFSPAVNATNNTGIWSGMAGVGELELLIREGDQAPGTSAGVLIGDLDGNFSVIINGGRVAFNADLTGAGVDGTNNTGTWSTALGTLTLVAREGDPAPGTDTTFLGVGYPAMNTAGQVAFGGVLTLPDPQDADLGIWIQDASGVVRLVIRDNDQIELAPGDFRTISDVTVGLVGTGGEGGRGTTLNDAGRIVFTGFLSDRRGIFITPDSGGPGGIDGGGVDGGADSGTPPMCGACGPGASAAMTLAASILWAARCRGRGFTRTRKQCSM